MARLTGIVALFAVVLLVADAYAYRTTITTVEVDEENRPGHERCKQMSAREELRSCEQFLRQQAREEVLQMRGIDNPQRREGAYFDECCRELRNVDEQCRCDLLEELAREEQRQARGQQGRQMLHKAKNLPSMCGIRQQQCDF